VSETKRNEILRFLVASGTPSLQQKNHAIYAIPCHSMQPQVFRVLNQNLTGWWFGTCLSIFPIILGMSSSQLTFIFFRGVAQPPTSENSWSF